MENQPPSFEEISDGGERVAHLVPNDIYYAHLSIYYFALQFCQGKTVLDAGSGAGYGSAYLADHGARRVDAFDIEEKAVKFSRYHFSKPNLTYQTMSIEKITGFPKKHFDVVFTSNALEHVPKVFPFFRSAWELLKPDGILVMAVPPVANELQHKANLENIYHLNIWSPRQWAHVLNLYFAEVQPYVHTFDKPGLELNFAHTPEETRINETDFIFEPVTVDDFYCRHTLTVIFVAKKPKAARATPFPNSRVTFVDDSFTRQLDSNDKKLRRLISSYYAYTKSTLKRVLKR